MNAIIDEYNDFPLQIVAHIKIVITMLRINKESIFLWIPVIKRTIGIPNYWYCRYDLQKLCYISTIYICIDFDHL